MLLRHYISYLCLVVYFGPSAFSQPSFPATQAGQSSISGKVTAGDGAIMGATVRVLRKTSQGWQLNSIVFTDVNGQWRVAGLEPTIYKILVSKPSFIAEQNSEFRREYEREIVLDKTGRLGSLNVHLTNGCVIAGRVIDERGIPVPKIEVSAVRQREVSAVDTGEDSQSWTFTADDLGNYRIFGLPPGKYLVGVGIRRHIRTNYHSPASLHGNNYAYKKLVIV